MKAKAPEDHIHEHSPCPITHKMSPVVPISSPSSVNSPWNMTPSPVQAVSGFNSFGMMSYNMSGSPHGPISRQPEMSVYHTPTGNMTLRNRVRNISKNMIRLYRVSQKKE